MIFLSQDRPSSGVPVPPDRPAMCGYRCQRPARQVTVCLACVLVSAQSQSLRYRSTICRRHPVFCLLVALVGLSFGPSSAKPSHAFSEASIRNQHIIGGVCPGRYEAMANEEQVWRKEKMALRSLVWKRNPRIGLVGDELFLEVID